MENKSNETEIVGFKICIDTEGYYTESEGTMVDVIEMPTEIKHAKELLAYRYNSETKLLELDESKLEEVRKEIKNEVSIPTSEERLADLEAAFLELSTMMLGGE